MTLHRNFRRLAITGLVLAATMPGAFAQDAAAFEERLKAVLAEQSLNISWSAAEQNGAQITLKGVTFNPGAGSESMEPVAVGDVVLDDVTEENGGYKIGKATFPNVSKTEDGMTVDASGITLTGVRVPAAGNTDPIAGLMLYETANLESLSVKQGDAQVFTLDQLHFELTPPEGDDALEFSGAAEKFNIDFSSAPDPQTKAVLGELGYTQMNGTMEINGSWDPKSGELSLAQYDFMIENAGTLGMTFDLGGYTTDFVKSVKDLQAKMAAQPAGSDNSAQGMAMLGLMQQLTFGAASVRFDDAGLTQKALDFIAKQQGMTANDIKNQAKAMVPFVTAQLGNPDLQNQISTAVSAFLDDPKSLEIAAEPASPVPFAQLAASASVNPLDLVKQLGVSVTANEAADDGEGEDGAQQ